MCLGDRYGGEMDWNPRYIVSKAPSVGGRPIPADEPCLVIRGQDRLAGEVMSFYIAEYEQLEGADPAVVDDLIRHADRLAEWQREHGTKTADR